MLTDCLAAGSAPIAAAFSGGGDSTALLHMILQRAKRRNVIALIVDHGLRSDSTHEAHLAAQRARAMGAKAEILLWQGEKPATAIQEQARLARYALMGDMCRKLGISQLFLGHNQDDQAETVWMRSQNKSGWRGLAAMGERRFAPIWPQLYDVEIIRPLLGFTREQLRAYNTEHNLDYINDPSNEDLQYRRVQARRELAHYPKLKAQCVKIAQDAQKCLMEERREVRAFIGDHADIHDWGGVFLQPSALQGNGTILRQSLKVIIQAVSGQGYSPPDDKIRTLAVKMRAPNFEGATLGGAQVIFYKDGLLIVRDPGMVMGRANKPAQEAQTLRENAKLIWDGRFVVTSTQKHIEIVPLMTLYDQLDKAQKQAIKHIPYTARAGLPACVKNGQFVATVSTDGSEKYQICSLVGDRVRNLVNG